MTRTTDIVQQQLSKIKNSYDGVICALYCDSDEQYLQNFIEIHRQYRKKINVCKVTEGAHEKIHRIHDDGDVTFYQMGLDYFDFSTAKNSLLKEVNASKVCFLDIDEHIAVNPVFLAEAFDAIEGNIGGVFVPVFSFYGISKEPNFFNAPQIRIFRGDLRFENKCHEQVYFDMKRKNLEAVHSRVLVMHYGYNNGEAVGKIARNLKLLCSDVAEGFDEADVKIGRQNYVLNMVEKTLADMKKVGYYGNP